MLPTQHTTTCLTLLAVCFVLMGVGCGDSDDDEVPANEEPQPAVVTIIGGWPDQVKRPDAEILADKILYRETEDLFFDNPQRNQLISEIRQVLSAIRAAYPLMNAIRAKEDLLPGVLAVYLEEDFYEIVEDMIRYKDGQFRFETGYAEFDALNAKLGVQRIRLDSSSSRRLIFYFGPSVNLQVASEAYSMVRGVWRAYRESAVEKSADIKAFKQGQTWYVIFRSAWDDCYAGCRRQELFCFTVTGAEVEMIPTAQAQTMPAFQELDSTQEDWSLPDATPFTNSPVYTWSWGDALLSEDSSIAFAGYDLGCSLYGEIEASPDQLRVSCGYRLAEPLPRLAKHQDGFNEIEDQAIDAFQFSGIVLLLIATQERTVLGKDEADSTVVASEPVRVAKTAAEVQSPENASFENVTIPIDPPGFSGMFQRWWGGVHPTFIVCWDHPETGQRAYQFLKPSIIHQTEYEVADHPHCDYFKDTASLQTLSVWWPLLDEHARSMGMLHGINVIPDPKNWTDWIDEVLPRPAAPEVED